MYDSERELALQKYFPDGFDEVAAGEAYGEHLLGATTDHLRELTHEERNRIFNLGYFTWVEQQGISIEDFVARRDPAFWTAKQTLARDWDALIDEFNARTGVLETPMRAAPPRLATRLVCAGCGASPPPGEPYPFRCPNAGLDDADHVLRRELDANAVSFPAGDAEPNPFLRFRALFHAYHQGLTDSEYCALVQDLDERVARVDGRGFAVTPFMRADELSDRLGFSEQGGVWVKDETGNVSGSHKARHLFGVLLWLEVAERVSLADPDRRRDLAIASCGNAALAAAVVAAAGGRTLRVFVPVDADPVVMERLEQLGARRHRLPARARRSRRPDRAPPARGARRRRTPLHLPGRPERPRGRGRAHARLGARRRRRPARPAGRAGRRRRARERVHPRARGGGRARRARRRCRGSTPSRPRAPGR